jgi:tetratricopeptide (TPR) repeat protein
MAPASVPAPVSRRRSWTALWPLACIVLAGALAYANSLTSPFIFDDLDGIRENATIRSLGTALFPPHDGSGVDSRPVVNLSLALDYAIGGLDVRVYHSTNLAIHLLAGLALYGIVRRTLARPGWLDEPAATHVGLISAVLWTVHPLQTESVSCMIQRTESLMGLFYLFTLYGFVRAAERPAARGWQILSVGACLLGMGTKEVMVSAPLLVLLHDRTFVAGTFRAAWRQRRSYYLALAATWLLLAALVLSSGGARGGAAGTGSGIMPWTYALTQCEAIARYLKLSLWPAPLVLDYGTGVAAGLGAVLPQGLLVLALVWCTGWALRARPAWGFLGAWFLVILAPSSSVLPLVTQTIAEHRMYLSLAAIVVAVVVVAQRWLGRHMLGTGVLLALLLGGLTFQRNHVYRSAVAIWQDTVDKVPANARAHSNLGLAFATEGRSDEAMGQLREAIRLQPDIAYAHYNLGLALARLGRDAEAVPEFEAELKLQPSYAPAWCELGLSLYQLGQRDAAVAAYAKALQAKPVYPDALERLGIALTSLGRIAEALTRYEQAMAAAPERASVRLNAGIAYAQSRQLAAAVQQFEAALQLDPDFAQAHLALAQALTELGQPAAAAVHREKAQRPVSGVRP